AARLRATTTVPVRLSRQPTTSWTVNSFAPVGLTAIQVCTPNQPRQLTARAEYTCTTASRVVAGSGASPAGSREAVRQSAAPNWPLKARYANDSGKYASARASVTRRFFPLGICAMTLTALREFRMGRNFRCESVHNPRCESLRVPGGGHSLVAMFRSLSLASLLAVGHGTGRAGQ